MLELKHFDMCSGALIPDVMHDLLDGTLQHILKLLLHYLMEKNKYLSISYLKQKIEGMELEYTEDTRPCSISHGGNVLRQNGEILIQVSENNNRCSSYTYDLCSVPLASQTRTLGRLLSMMVGDKISKDDEYWQHYLTTLEIADYILASKLLSEEVAYLKVLLTEHHTTFVRLYPEA